MTPAGWALAVLLASSAPAIAEIIPAARRIDWAPGIPGGIPVRTTICANATDPPYDAAADGVTDDTDAIQAALDDCPDDQVVFLPAGTYRVTDTIHLYDHDTLRGAGMGQTILLYTGTSLRSIVDIRGSAYNDIFNLERSFAITSGLAKGSTSLTLANPTGISVGDVLLVDQQNDGVLVDPVGYEGLCGYCGRANGSRARGHFVTVTAVAGAVVTVNPPLYWSLDPTLSPQATLVNASSMIRWAGVEDLTLTEADAAVEFMIEMDAAQYCWLRNVEVERIKRRAVWLIESLQSEIRGSYFHDAIGGFGRDRGYAVMADLYSTANLVEDNVFHTTDGGFIMAAGGAAGNAFTFNYMFDTRFDDPWWMTASPSLSHGPHPSMNLWEGNVGVQAASDFIHGSASHNTVFRNAFTGWQDETITSNNNAIELQYKNTYMNVAGCVLGTPGRSAVYEVAPPDPGDTDLITIWRLGYGGPGFAEDPNVEATLLRHGNFDYVTNDTRWDPAIADHVLPASLLYGSERPPFWESCRPWPPIGPDVDGLVTDLPAKDRFEGETLTCGPSTTHAAGRTDGVAAFAAAHGGGLLALVAFAATGRLRRRARRYRGTRHSANVP